MPRRRLDVKRQFRTTRHVVEALDGRVSFEDVDAVINALWWDETTTVLPDDPDGHGPFGRRRIVDDGDLEKVRDLLDIVRDHFVGREIMESTMQMRPVKASRLHDAVRDALGRVLAMLQDPEDD